MVFFQYGFVFNFLGKSFDHEIKYNSAWVFKHLRRYVPPPIQLLPRVLRVFLQYAPIEDGVTGAPLFNADSFKSAKAILKHIAMGCLSDPPGMVNSLNFSTL